MNDTNEMHIRQPRAGLKVDVNHALVLLSMVVCVNSVKFFFIVTWL